MFWDNFERLCVKKGVSPNKVCKELGFSNATATHWKQGAKPNNGTVLRVADYFGVTPEELLQDEKKKPPVETEGEYDEDEDFKAFSKVLGDLTPEELQKVLSYAEFVLKQRNP